jgi:putative ABC transport system permease protein
MDGDLRLLTIAGIVGDVRHRGPEAKPDPTFYVNARQRPTATADYTLVVNTAGDPASLVAQVRGIARALDPEVPPRLQTIEQVFASSLANRRYSLWLVASFALAALVLAVVGIYGVVSYGVAQRTRELGVRMALGARPAQVVALVLSQGGKLIVAGLVLGSVGALVMTRFMRTFLFEIAPTDPITYVVVCLVLTVAAVAACEIPALRASRVDPVVALRTDP